MVLVCYFYLFVYKVKVNFVMSIMTLCCSELRDLTSRFTCQWQRNRQLKQQSDY